jgi:hypothetical protein
MKRRAALLAFVALGFATPVAAQSRNDVLYRAMRDELARSMARLRLDTMPAPYFLAYRVQEVEYLGASARLGSLVGSYATRHRGVAVELRVGDYTFDNTNFMGGTGRAFGSIGGAFVSERGLLPLDDNYLTLRRHLWLATDAAYKAAVEALANKRAALESRARTDYVPDLSREPVTTLSDVPEVALPDLAAGEALVRGASALFRERPAIQQSAVSWSANRVRTWYVNSEGNLVRPGDTLRFVGCVGRRAGRGWDAAG